MFCVFVFVWMALGILDLLSNLIQVDQSNSLLKLLM